MTVLETHNDPALAAEIRALAKARNAVILAHNYERPEIQDVLTTSATRLVSRAKRRVQMRT